jgi:7tm Odorant receptor
MLIQVIRPCFHANTVEFDTNELSCDLFSSDWTECDLKYKKLVVIFMENLKKSVKFEAFGFVNVNLDLFLQVIDFSNLN